MVDTEELLPVVGGAIGGIGIPYLVHRYYDTDPTTQMPRQIIPTLGDYGTPSALTGIGTGVAALALGIFGDRIGMYDARLKKAALTYGVAAIGTTLLMVRRAEAPVATAARARMVSATAAPAAVAAPAAAQRYVQTPVRKPRTY